MEPLLEGSDALAEKLLEMSQFVESSICLCVDAVVSRSSDAALTVFTRQSRVNQLQALIDAGACRLRERQPAGADPAFAAAAGKIGRSLLRMGDLVVAIGAGALTLLALPICDPGVDFRRMGERTCARLHDGIEAFVRGDADLARGVLNPEGMPDPLHDAYAEIMKFMDRDPVRVHPGLEYVFIVRDLQRLDDHAAGVAEDALFFAQVSGRAERGAISPGACAG